MAWDELIMKRIGPAAFVICLAFFLWFSSAGMAYAYLDPGLGSILVQMLIGGIAGVIMVLKLYWAKVKGFFSSNGVADTNDLKNSSSKS
jgi:hypothetical protein